MSVVSVPIAESPALTPSLPLYRLSVEQYHAMIHAGILSEQDTVELLEGLLVQKMTRNPPQAIALHPDPAVPWCLALDADPGAA